ncbi:MAG: hypothetical protein RIT81_17690 [Deltaproteobacteria bacterium]
MENSGRIVQDHLAHVLPGHMVQRRRKVLDKRGAALIARSKALSGAPLDLQLRVLEVLRAVPRTTRPVFFAFVDDPRFIALPRATALLILAELLGHPGAVEAVGALTSLTSFGALPESTQMALVTGVVRHRTPVARALLLALVEAPGFVELSPAEQARLVRFARGPRVRASRERRRVVDGAWDALRAPLLRLARRDDADSLCSHLDAASEAVTVFHGQALNGRTIVTIGGPDERVALSWGRRRYMLTDGVDSPDPVVEHAWRGHPDAVATYRWKKYLLTPDEVLGFVEWMEATFVERQALPNADRQPFVEDVSNYLCVVTRAAEHRAPVLGYSVGGKIVSTPTVKRRRRPTPRRPRAPYVSHAA